MLGSKARQRTPKARTVELIKYDDIVLPNRRALVLRKKVSLVFAGIAALTFAVLVVWLIHYWFNVDPYVYEYWYLDMEPPAGPQFWQFVISAVVFIASLLSVLVAKDKYYQYFVRVRQGEIVDMGFDSEGDPYITIRGYTYANELKDGNVYPRRLRWVELQNEWKYEGRTTVDFN